MNARAQLSSAFQREVANFVPRDSSISTFQTKHSQHRVANPRSEWNEELKDRFDQLTALPRGWDGYAGRPVSFTCAQFASILIERLFVADVPAPQLVPGGDGTLQIEWHRNQFDLEIVVFAPYEVSATRIDLVSGVRQEIELESDFSDLGVWITDLGRVRAVDHRMEA